MKRSCLEVSAEKRNARKADKIRLCGHLRRYKKIVKKTYITSAKNMYSIVSKLEESGYALDSGRKIHNNSGRPSRFIMLNFW